MVKNPKVLFKKVDESAKIPVRNKPNDAGYDCFVNGFRRYNAKEDKFEEIGKEPIILKHGDIVGCELGFMTALPKGYYAQLVPRSGLAFKNGICIGNTPATIDEGYRGEWVAIIINNANMDYKIKVGDKICQMILRKMIEFDFDTVDVLPESERGANGFGSSGK